MAKSTLSYGQREALREAFGYHQNKDADTLFVTPNAVVFNEYEAAEKYCKRKDIDFDGIQEVSRDQAFAPQKVQAPEKNEPLKASHLPTTADQDGGDDEGETTPEPSEPEAAPAPTPAPKKSNKPSSKSKDKK